MLGRQREKVCLVEDDNKETMNLTISCVYLLFE